MDRFIASPALTLALLLSFLAPNYIDLALGLFTLLDAVALTLLGLRERDTFPWDDFNRREYVRRWSGEHVSRHR